VNDAAARTVALGVVLMATTAVVTDWVWLLVPLTYGFVARVVAGPRFSPLGRLAVHVVAPRLPRWRRLVPGPPKRFAQAIGATLTLATCALTLAVGFADARWVLLPLVAAAALEGGAGYCLGCAIFARLMRAGLIPASVCAECGDLDRARRATF
jgi:hypothetical protein